MSETRLNPVNCFSYASLLIELSKRRKLTGYDIIVHMRKLGFEVSPGTVYHQLDVLSKDGIIRGEKKSNRTVYEMTEKGIEDFQKMKRKWANVLEYVYQNLRT